MLDAHPLSSFAQVLMTAAGNCLYGSLLSPPRAKQVKECVWEYLEDVNPETDHWFQFWLPHLIISLKLDITASDEDAAQVSEKSNESYSPSITPEQHLKYRSKKVARGVRVAVVRVGGVCGDYNPVE